GGGGSFGIVLSWKVKLVHVPSTVTVFSVGRTLEQNATQLLHRWQYVAPSLPNDVYSVVSISSMNSTENGERTVLATFTSVFQGVADELIPLMQERFPELGKSDYVRKPMPEIALQGLWSRLLEVNETSTAIVNIISYGGKMDEIPETETAFPHRKGTLYKINYNIVWQEEENSNPQSYRDLDIGRNNDDGKTSYKQASVWGRKYFKNNFDRLTYVKAKIDPENFFRHEQSIPPRFH
ncbi:hypothetical protein Goarm_012371, partial [Gossypium armourianum]|nr:hypothetical protein [Gossypium armourianum]